MKYNKIFGFILSLCLAASALSATPDGKVRFVKRQDQSFDPYTDTQSPVIQQWIKDKFMRMMEYSPYFDGKTAWYKNGLIYIDSYAIYRGSADASNHPDWILKDANGNQLYIPYDCGGGTCPQYAADISNPAYRRAWIDNAKAIMTRASYLGLWVDDVNTNFSVGDGNGNFVNPIDPNTRAPMTWDAWRGYIAAFMQQIRQELPNIEILHNSVWYAGPDGIRDTDPAIKAQIAAADYINIERGINDGGLTGGTGSWSLSAVFSFIDRLHAAGKGAVIDDFALDRAGREYALAGYFLITNGNDRIGNQSMTPDNWWNGYDVDLGTPLADRYAWNSLLRRDFANGMVLLNEPQAPARTVTLPAGSWKTLDGSAVTTVTLSASQGVVLVGSSALSISGITGSASGQNAASVAWSTNRMSDSKIEYGTSTAYGSLATNVAMATSHAMSLSSLAAGTTYHYRVTSKDATGVAATSGDFTFTTAPVPAVTTPLTISSASPASGATQVSINTAVSITFASAVIQSSLTNNVYLAKSGATTAVGAQVSLNAAANMITLTPTVALSGSTSYQVIIKGGTAGVKSATGATLTTDVTWSFTTGSSTQVYLSDLTEGYQVNGWGPMEHDRSNGEQGATDGHAITLNGRTYAKGLGVHAYSNLRYQLDGACSSFSAVVGVDGEVPAGWGSVVFQVWADGQKLYESSKMNRDTAAANVLVNITGKRQLSLVVNDAGDGVGNDHGDWAQALVTCTGRPSSNVASSVGSLSWLAATNGWGPVERNMSNGERNAGDGKTISINGVTFATGLGVHADTEVKFAVTNSCSSFQATVGVDDEVPLGNATVIFQVWSDGVKLYDSCVMSRGTAAQKIYLPLDSPSQLSLVVTSAGDGNGWDHADWAGATLHCSKALPTAP